MTAAVLRPRMMDVGAQSCAASGDGFHWVASAEDVAPCRLCGASCEPLPNYVIDPAVVDEINALAAARARGKGVLPCRERWNG